MSDITLTVEEQDSITLETADGGATYEYNYNNLTNKPKINSVELSGNKSLSDLGIQETLVSGTNIKTVNNQSILGSGNLSIQSGTWGQINGDIEDQTDLQEALDGKLNTEDTVIATSIGIDSTPTASSTNLVTSGGVRSALDGKQDNLTAGTGLEIVNNVISLYQSCVINSFTCDKSSTNEKGSTVSNPNFTWSLNKNPSTLKFNNESLSVSDRSKSLTVDITSNTTYTLSLVGGQSETASRSVTLSFLNGVYYGKATLPSTIDSAFILTLSKELRSNKKPSFTVNAGANEYIWYCLPTSYGTPTFKVGGFEGGFDLVSTLQFTNASGYSEEYKVYRSTNANLGQTTVEVS